MPISDAQPTTSRRSPPLLEFKDVHTFYGELHVLKGVSYRIGQGEIVCLLGGNACGKSTTMKTILGLVTPARGEVTYAGQLINKLPTAERVKRGIAPVPEARRLFPRMSVAENLEMGAYTRTDGPAEIAADLDRVYGLFPRIKERLTQQAGTLSGGEQQMVAMARALMARPKLLCMDEPSMGLSLAFVDQVFDIIQAINRQGTSILMVEQNANMALSIAHYGYVLQTGGGAGGRCRTPAQRPDRAARLSRRGPRRLIAERCARATILRRRGNSRRACARSRNGVVAGSLTFLRREARSEHLVHGNLAACSKMRSRLTRVAANFYSSIEP